ncbi:hypothetical protein C8F04DRAFT_177025 [Mycena alexandri]|uniref:Uncharacterized protein n=1 Tax=Mycena alexandri TaxID=1745969 RepID=A0AAD6S9H9_9AGAR|nr:hypothetical protein C8F04DRAFT_177025 [Mycena alexandri]
MLSPSSLDSATLQCFSLAALACRVLPTLAANILAKPLHVFDPERSNSFLPLILSWILTFFSLCLIPSPSPTLE